MEITLGEQYNVGEKPTVILYIYILIVMQGHQITVKTMELVIYGARQFGVKEYFFWMRWLLRILMGNFLGSMVTLVCLRQNTRVSFMG